MVPSDGKALYALLRTKGHKEFPDDFGEYRRRPRRESGKRDEPEPCAFRFSTPQATSNLALDYNNTTDWVDSTSVANRSLAGSIMADVGGFAESSAAWVSSSEGCHWAPRRLTLCSPLLLVTSYEQEAETEVSANEVIEKQNIIK